MTTYVPCTDRARNLTADEEAGCYTTGHEIGCDCPDCRPDLDEELRRIAAEVAA